MYPWASALRNAASPEKALCLFSRLHQNAIPFDSYCFLFTLKFCTHLRSTTIIRHLHAHIVKLGFSSHVYVATSLLNAYVVCYFRDACILFDEMPDKNTVTWNTMITGYSKSGDIKRARLVFDEMPYRDMASWSAMIAAYTNTGRHKQGLSVFREMVVDEGIKPDEMAAASVLSGCAQMGPLGLLAGKSIHGFFVKNEWQLNVELGTVLVNMYAKCGFLRNASQVFELMQKRNILTWTALICGSAQHGYIEHALAIFEKMRVEGIKPNELTFTGVLSACAQSGLVKEGRMYFNMIEEHYGMKPTIQHYGCMVDLLGKAGMLEESYEIIKTMKLEPNVAVWSAFLSACREHKQFGMAERVIKQVLKMVKPENNGGVYSLICDLYVLGEKWEEAERLRKLMLDENVRKVRGSSFVRSGLSVCLDEERKKFQRIVNSRYGND
ncbi:hypothetical protein L6164_034888 [Bauhinia variegata]|uniref:Uncharacterized protein n=1 Tax=Bauhinia variegata TaxID=167791 RepID=A0ACB9KWX2_BAUVA|nr:hypothetical protein L6164_034888 [Bauhinia variegata]